MTALALPAWLTLLVVVLATARIFRLLTVDDIAWPIRKRVLALVDDEPKRLRDGFHDMFFCPFCAGFWLGLGVLASALAWSDTIVWQILAIGFAANYVQAHLNARLDVASE